MIKFIFFISFLPIIFSLSQHMVHIDSDDDCWSNEKNNTIDKTYGVLVKFSTKVAYGKDNCSIHITNPWLTNMQNGFGIFITSQMDCSSMIVIDCLSDSKEKNYPIKFTCHTSDNKIQLSCNTINLIYKRNLKIQETKRATFVQIVPLAKGPCIDNDVLYQCSTDYLDSCINEKLRCNGRSECPNGDDERNCHPIRRPAGLSILVILLIVLGFLFLICILPTVLICCCCRAAFNSIVRRFRTKKAQKGDITITGEDAGLMKSLTTPATVVSVLPTQQYNEPASLIIDSTKPIYPHLE